MSEGLSVALLLSDIQEVKEISSVFRKLGIIPHYYEDLKTFWQGTLERIPSLCIVDVKKMSEGDLALSNHPHIQTEKLPIVFFYTNNTEPLLISTNEFFHLGLLKKCENYEAPLKSILKRINHFLVVENDNKFLKEEKEKLTLALEMLKMEKLALVQTDQYQTMVKSICLMLEECRGERDFFQAIEQVFQRVDEFNEFALMELSFNGQKLISPISHVQKFRSIPSLWLGQACSNGIELFAQNMATQVAVDIMGGDLVSLLIKGKHSRPDKIMFIKSKNELFYNQFDWNMLEAYLNGYYASFQSKVDTDLSPIKKFSSTYEAMNFLDQFLYGSNHFASEELKNANKMDYRLIDLDLSSLINLIMKKNGNRFFWNKFEKEFINRLEIQSRRDFRVFDYGVNHLAFLVLAKDLDVFFDELKVFSSKFSYWKYFEDSESMITQLIQPKVTMVPLSSFAYIKSTQVAQDADLVTKENKEVLAKLRTRELIWGKDSIHEV